MSESDQFRQYAEEALLGPPIQNRKLHFPRSQQTKYAADAFDQERNLRERIHEQSTYGIDDKKVFNRPRGRNDP